MCAVLHMPAAAGHPDAVGLCAQYKEMRDEFLASLEDRRFLSLADAQKQSLQVSAPCPDCGRRTL